jgi:biopolymer transport protein ExbB
MKNYTNVLILVACFAVAFAFYYLVMGAAGNFENGDIHSPINVLGTIYTGGPLVAVLLACCLIAITYTIERQWSIGKASGKGQMHEFGRAVIDNVRSGNYAAAMKACDEQRGSLANILRAAVERFKTVESEGALTAEQRVAEVQRVIDENMNLETPLLEKNLVILSTVASTATMVGLLGTTLGMIRAFSALGAGGTVSAQMLSIGISEALYNTAGGLAAAIIAILAYNYFTTKVDNFTYTMDETILDLMETLAVKTGGSKHG